MTFKVCLPFSLREVTESPADPGFVWLSGRTQNLGAFFHKHLSVAEKFTVMITAFTVCE